MSDSLKNQKAGATGEEAPEENTLNTDNIIELFRRE